MMDLVKDLSKEGRPVREILQEPFHFLVELTYEEYRTVKKETSLIAAFSPVAK